MAVTARIRKARGPVPVPWSVTIIHGGVLHVCGARTTFQAALDHALESVGLTVPAEHREAP